MSLTRKWLVDSNRNGQQIPLNLDVPIKHVSRIFDLLLSVQTYIIT